MNGRMAHDRSPQSYIIRSINRFVSESEGLKLSKLLASKRLVIDPRQLDGPLLESCRSPGRDKCVQPLLDAGADPNCSDSDGRTPLYLLLEKGAAKPPVMKTLLKAGASPNKATYTTQLTPFHLACKKGLQVCVQVLLGFGAQLDKGDGHGNTPLILAAKEGHYTGVRMLLLEGANPNKYNHVHETALHFVAKNGNHDTVVDLMSCHADPDIKDLKGQTALLLAAKNSHLGIVQTLIENGSDLFVHDLQSGRSALHWAIVNNNMKLAILLINGGIDLNAKDKNWQTPFMLALTTGKTDTVEQLLNVGCDVTITDKARNTSLHLAARDGRKDLIRRLIKAGIAVDIKGAGGATPLMLGAYGGHAPVVHTLLQQGADPDLGDRNSATAVMYCMFSTNDNKHIQSAIKELVRANCNLNKKAQLLNFAKTLPIPSQFVSQLEDRMYRPVECALLRGKMIVFMMLLKAGCDVSGVNGNKLLLHTYLYDAGVSPKHRRLMLRYLAIEHKRVKSLVELCRRPVRIMLNARGLSRNIALLPLSDQLRQFLNYEDLDMLEEEMSGDPLSSTIMSWGSTTSLTEGPGTPKSPTNYISLPVSPIQNSPFHQLNKVEIGRKVSKARDRRSYGSRSSGSSVRDTHQDQRSYVKRSPMSSESHSGASSPVTPLSPGGDSQHLRRFLDELPPVAPGEPPLSPDTYLPHEYGSKEQMAAKDEDHMSRENKQSQKYRHSGIKKALPQLNLSNFIDDELDNNNESKTNDNMSAAYNNNNIANNKEINIDLIGTNIKTHGDSTMSQSNCNPVSPPCGSFSRNNPLRHSTSRIPRSEALYSPKKKYPGKPKMARQDNDMPLSPTSTDSSFSSFSFSTEEDSYGSDKISRQVSKSPTANTNPASSYFSRQTPTRKTFHTTRDMDRSNRFKGSSATSPTSLSRNSRESHHDLGNSSLSRPRKPTATNLTHRAMGPVT